jgi:hypothetical protein
MPNDSSAVWSVASVKPIEAGDSSAVWAVVSVKPLISGVSSAIWGITSIRPLYPVAAAADIEVSATLGPLTFDASDSVGSKYRWSFTSVPAGSALTNTQTAFPDNGGSVGPISMTDNEGLYHFDALVSSEFADTSGNVNTATVTAGVTKGTGKITGTGSAVFAGTTDVLTLGTPVPTDSVDWAIGFWFKGLKPNTQWRTGAFTTTTTAAYAIMVETGTNNLGVYDGGFVDSGFDMPSASYTGWNHIMVSGTAAGKQTFYVNGIAVGSTTLAFTDPITTVNNHESASYLFADEISELAVYSRALAEDEAWQIFALQEGSYVGAEVTLDFTPDVRGDYETLLEVASGNATIDAKVVRAVAGPPDVVGPIGPLTLDASESTGTLFRWKWSSVPADSALANATPVPYPDSGAATPIDMTNNEVLYHTDAIVGGTSFADSSGNANDAAISGTITLGTGKIGAGSASLDTAASYLIPAVGVSTPLDSWTVSMWFKGLKPKGQWRSAAKATQHYIIVENYSDRLGIYNTAFSDSASRWAQRPSRSPKRLC